MDLTGRFPYKSSRGNEHISIMYHVDSNSTLGIPMKNRQAGTITQIWIRIKKKFKLQCFHQYIDFR